jgi:hypothetical protein
LFGDSHFSTVAIADLAYANDFEPGFTSKEAGRPAKMFEEKRRLRIVAGTEPEPGVTHAELEMDSRGRYYCPCDATKPFRKRRQMHQVPTRFGKDFILNCEHCPRRDIEYRTNRTGGKIPLGNGHWQRGTVGTLVRALRHDDRRALAISHYSRNLHEHDHSLFRFMGLLSTERLSQRKHITGKFRHDLWYALGAIVFNETINRNFENERVSREELDWHDLYVAAVRNGASAVSRKDARKDNEERKAASSAERAARKRRKRNAQPPGEEAQAAA